MKTEIIYPVLIIIFSILIIFAIINNKNNNKLNIGVEKFMNQYLENRKDILKDNVDNNNENTKNIAEGSWTNINTTVDDTTKKVSNLTNIVIDNTINFDNLKDFNYGSIVMNNDVYKINMILNQNITGFLQNNNSQTIHIRFFNIFNKDSKVKLNKIFNDPLTYNAEVSIFVNDTLINKYISYKVYDSYADDQLYRIIKSRNYYINKPPPVYDINAYNIITGGSYKYPNNYIYFGNGSIQNAKAFNVLQNKYFNKIKFAIVREFVSPSGSIISTQKSDPLLLNITNFTSPNIPSTLNIVPFLMDKNVNGLTTFFKPNATKLYFFKALRIDTTYTYKDLSLTTQPNSVLNLSSVNNSTNMYESNILYNKLNTVQKINDHIYKMIYVGTKKSDLNNITTFDFNEIVDIILK